METIITTFFSDLFDSIAATLYSYCSLITIIFQEKQLFVSVILLLFLSSFFSDSRAYIDLLKGYTEWVLDMGAFFITGGDNVGTEQC